MLKGKIKQEANRENMYVRERVIILQSGGHKGKIFPGRGNSTGCSEQGKALGQHCAWHARGTSNKPVTLERS